MSALFRNLRETLRPHRPACRKSFSLTVEGLDRRALLSGGFSHALAARAEAALGPREVVHNGAVVEKRPSFDPNFVGPQLPQFEAVKASGKLLKNGSFTFTGVNRGAIDPNMPATYVFGVDRNGHLPTPGPIPGHPDLQGDATVYVQVRPGMAPTVKVYQLETNQYTTLQNPAVTISGKSVSVNIPGSMLPSTGLAPSQYRFGYWTYWPHGSQTWANCGSLAPEVHPIKIGVSRA
jgi:hypothetical protein